MQYHYEEISLSGVLISINSIIPGNTDKNKTEATGFFVAVVVD